MRTLIPILCLAALAVMPSGCSLYREDRCFVPPQQYEDARSLYIETGSLEIVQRRMEEMQWAICKRNEVTYRLQKEFQVLPEEVEVESAATNGTAQPATEPADAAH